MSRAVPGLAPVGVAVTAISTVGSVLLVGDHPDRIAYVFVGVWALALSLVGALVASRRPENPIGWLFLVSAAFVSLSSLAQACAERSLPSGTFLEPAAWLTLWLAVPGFGIFVWVFLLFPTGALLSPRWVWVMRAAFVGLVLMVLKLAFRPGPIDSFPAIDNPLGVESAKSMLDLVGNVGEGLLISAAVAAAVSLVLRTFRTKGVERLQMKWFAFSVLFLPIAFFAGEAIQPLDPTEEDAFTFLLIMFALLAIPTSMGVAILRHRLYDIDRLINRTLVYTVLTAILAGAYLLAVLALQSILPLPDQSPAIVAASTLAVVAAFRPLRKRVQEVVDKRFYRSRYDASLTIERFGVRLRAQTDLEGVTDDLISMTRQTMQPATVSLWLREGWASTPDIPKDQDGFRNDLRTELA
jgi:hypothetical protein